MASIDNINKLYKEYKTRFPDMDEKFFQDYLKKKSPEDFKLAQRTNWKPGSTIQQLIDTGKKVVDKAKKKGGEVIQKNADKMEEALRKNGLKPSSGGGNKPPKSKPPVSGGAANPGGGSGKAAGIITRQGAKTGAKVGLGTMAKKVAGKVIAPVASLAFDAPQATQLWNDPNSTWQDKLTAASIIPAAGAWLVNPVAGLGATAVSATAINKARQNQLDKAKQQNNSVIQPTTQELITAGNKALADSDELYNQAQQGIAENQEAQDWLSNSENRIAAQTGNLILSNNQMRAIAGPGSPTNYGSGTSKPITSLTPINGAPTSSGYQLGAAPNVPTNGTQPPAIRDGNGGVIQNPPTTEGNMDNNNQQIQFNNSSNDLLNRVNMMSELVKGAQSNNQLPDIGVSPEELNLMYQQLQDYGKNLSGALSDIEAYKKAIEKDRRADAITGMLGGVGNIVSNIQPMQRAYDILPNGTTFDFGAPTPANYNDVVDRARKTPGNADYVAKMLEVNKQVADLSRQQYEQQAKLYNAARISNATGLPINVTMNMEPKDYLGYIKEIQTAQRELGKQGLTDVDKLIDTYTGKEADYQREMDLQGLRNKGTKETTAMQQYGEGVRKEAELNTQVAIKNAENKLAWDIAQLNADNKETVTRMLGDNAIALEKLKQKDPNAYLKALAALGNLFEPGVYMGNPQTNQAYNKLINDLLNNSTNNSKPMNSKEASAQEFNRIYGSGQ